MNIPTGRKAELLALLINGEMYGYQISKEYKKRYRKSIPIGTLYTTMSRAEEDGFVKSRISEETSKRGGNRRKYFQLTANGMQVAVAIDAIVDVAKLGRSYG